MNYSFPLIRHIDDVLPAIKDSPEFIVAEKDGYKVVNYVVATHETFPEVKTVRIVCGWDESEPVYETKNDHYAAIRRECRGLVFDMEGNLINRRYHKFFNVNERAETQFNEIDWSKPHVILEKLDGSMVSPCFVNGHIRWMTKMGITDTSMEAEAFVAKNPDYNDLAGNLLLMGYTPIFEWCSNKNRIVLDYPEDRLVLTAVRHNAGGIYCSMDTMGTLVGPCDIPIVDAWPSNGNPNELVEWVRRAEDSEGVVVRFDDGHMVKIKSDWYVRIHKVKSLLGQERDVVKLILNNELDDLLPVLPKEDVEKVEAFKEKLTARLRHNAWGLLTLVGMYVSLCDRKTFALEHAPKMNSMWKSMVFKFWDKEINDQLTFQAIVDIILLNCGNNQSYAKVKEAFLKDVDYG